jgi:purine-binding chemotaxis protein CheW
MSTRLRGAAAGERETADEEQQQYLTFRVGTETLALGILTVKEILDYGHVTDVPMMPACVRGVINLRGRVVPVVDLAVRFGRTATVPSRRTCIVIVEVEADGDPHDIGVLVDAVNQVLEIPAEDIEPAPAFGTRLQTEFIAGLGKVEGQFVVIVNSDRVLALEELARYSAPAAPDGPAVALTPPPGL